VIHTNLLPSVPRPLLPFSHPQAQIAARLAQNKSISGAGGTGHKTGVQRNTNPQAKFGASSMDFNGYDKDKAAADKDAKAKSKGGAAQQQSMLGKSNAAITGGNLEYGHKEDVEEVTTIGGAI